VLTNTVVSMRLRTVTPRIWMKLTAIALSFMIPLIVTTFFLVKEQGIKINFAAQELRGDRYLRPLSQLLVHVELHRAFVREGDAAQANRAETLVEADFDALLATDRDLRSAIETTGTDLNALGRGDAAPARLKASWESVKLAGDVATSERLHGELVGHVRTLISHVGDSSKLILDPDLDTYYVMDALLLKEPEIISELSDLGAAIDMRAPGDPGVDDAAALAGSVALLKYQRDGLATDLQTAFAETANFNHNDDLKPALSSPLTRGLNAINRVADLTAPTVDRGVYASAVRDAIDAHTALWGDLFDQQDKMLDSR
jgi:hypothetical protein